MDETMSSLTIRTRPAPAEPADRMSLVRHLRELRRRLIIVLVIVAVGAIAGWYFYDPIMVLLERPYCSISPKYRFDGTGGQCVLVYHGALDGFTTRLKVAVLAGVVFTGPLWLYQIWAFIAPGLHKKERRYTVTFVAASTVLFAAGGMLADLVLRKGLSVLLAQSGANVQAMLTVNSYLSFVIAMVVTFGLAFELPLLIVMANLTGILSGRMLKKSQRVSIFLIFVFAAIATPSSDPFTMCAMAVPLVVLFEAAVLFAVLHDRRAARRRAADRITQAREDSVPTPFADL
jgi:sec-independent protein translocase protein TatC